MSLFQQLYDNYNDFHISEIENNRFKPMEFYQALEPLAGKFDLIKLGSSVEGRPIYSITLGKGSVRVLLWSQMHGNESTATRAILDILQFFKDPGLQREVSQNLEDKLTICIVPMLNPDGGERFQRRNAQEIDINRDAKEFASPEANILRSIIKEFKPDFALNLHDQKRFYNIKGTAKPSTIAFLAPAFNEQEEINQSRSRAMQLIASMRKDLETTIPGQVGLYDDSFSLRAFGDYCQAQGVSTILVESGWAVGDSEKELVRKLNFCFLVSAFNTIANNDYDQFTIADYQRIPANDEKLFDVLIRDVTINLGKESIKYDIGIQRTEVTIPGSTDFYSVGIIADIGDLKEWYGFEEVAGEDLYIECGKVCREYSQQWQELAEEEVFVLLKQGYLYLMIDESERKVGSGLPINLIGKDFSPPIQPIFENSANLVLRSASGKIRYIVLNGFLWDQKKSIPQSLHGVLI